MRRPSGLRTRASRSTSTPTANRRSTFTFGDSHLGPADVGTLDEFHCVQAAFRDAAWPSASPGRALDDYRGPHMPTLAKAVAAEYAEVIDAAVVGRFANEPERWSRFGEPDELLQYAEHLWHTLVHYGRPIEAKA